MKLSIFNRLSVDMRRKSVSALLTLLLCAPAVSTATAFNNLNHWLEHAPLGEAADWTAKAGIQSMVEDNGHGRTGYLGPGYGGQEYDAEAIYVNKSGNLLEIAVVTGMSPDPTHTYGPGDIAIDLGYIQGGPASFEIGIRTTGAHAGEIYQVGADGWDYGLWDTNGNHVPGSPDPAHPTSMNSSDKNKLLGSLDDNHFYYGEAKYGATSPSQLGKHSGDMHYLIAVRIDLNNSDLGFLTGGLGGAFLAHWTMNCANDIVEVGLPPAGAAASVPEPAALLLALSGLIGLIGSRRFRNAA